MATASLVDIKTPLISRLDLCDIQIRRVPKASWFTTDFIDRTLSTQGELDSIAQLLSDQVKPSAERTLVMESIHALRNLLTSWYEGLSQNLVTADHQKRWRLIWSDKVGAIKQAITKIVQLASPATLPVLEDTEATEEAALVQPAKKKRRDRQQTLFTTEAKLRQNPALKEFKLEGAEDAIEEWRSTRSSIPLATTKGAPLFAVTKIPIIPSMERIANEDTFRRLGIMSRSIGMYHVLYDQIILGINMYRVRDKGITNVEREDLIEQQLVRLSDHYGTKMILATEKTASLLDNGYQFYWVIAEATLSLMQSRANNYPKGWSLS